MMARCIREEPFVTWLLMVLSFAGEWSMVRTIAAAFLGLALTAGAAHADSWKFDVHNKSKSVVKAFRTKEDGKWSGNWIRGDRIKPGDTFEMDFGTSEGQCVVRTQITFTDDSYFDYDVDYCNVEALYIYEDRVTGK
jgi:hypothetical protein